MSGATITYSYEGVPTLQQFAASDAFIRGISGCVGSGKSSACVVEIIRRAQMQRPSTATGYRKSRWAVIRNTVPELRETTMRTVFQWLPPAYFGKFTEHKHTYVVNAFERCDIEILFLALDRPDDVKKLLSLELTGAWINEAREVPWAVFEALQARVGRYPAKREGGASWFGIWADTNPPDTDSKWYRFFEEKGWLKGFRDLQRSGDLPPTMRPEDYVAYFKQPSGLSAEAENLDNLPGGRRYYANLVAGKSKDWVDVYVHGEYGFVVDGKPVFPEYNDRIHCRETDPIEGLPIYRGWDFGLTPACCFSQMLPNGTWLIFDEMTSDRMGIDRFSDEVLDHCARSFARGAQFIDYGDPAGEQAAQTDERTCFEIMWAKGIRIEGGEQNLTIRLETMRRPMRLLGDDGEPQFAIHPRCKTLRKALKGGYCYRRMQVSGERYTSQPAKDNYSHVADAAQYVATRLFGSALVKPHDAGDELPFDRGYGRPDFAALATRSKATGY